MNRRIDRRCHWLGHNKDSSRPSIVLFFDTEAKRHKPSDNIEQHAFRLGVACLCRYQPGIGLSPLAWRDLSHDRDLWSWVEEITSNEDDIILVSHNIDYDARLSRAFYFLPRLGWAPAWCVMARSCTIFAWEREGQKLMLLDNLNLMPSSLADIGESLDIPKLDVDFDASPDSELLVYCRRDVEILVSAWRRWLEFLDAEALGNFGITVAKQAWNAYRHRFMPVKIGIHNNADAIDLEREAYRGARCEVFRVGKLPPGTYYKLDVNGLYAAMMSWYPYPRKLVKVIENVRWDYLNYLLRDYLVIARVCLQVGEPKYPIRVQGRNVFPTGAYFTTLTTPELQVALDAGEIVGIGKVALYESADLFSDYVTWATDLRQEYKAGGDLARSNMVKLLRNSLQGKFGQKGHHQEIVGDAPIDKVSLRRYYDLETGHDCTDWTFGGKVIRQYDEGEPFDSFPAIPAHVAAYGRLYMWSLICQAGRRNVFYTDTDSLLVSEEGFNNLAGMIDPLKLGFLKIEGVARDVEINAKKDYTFGEDVHIKGVKKDAYCLNDQVFRQWHFTGLRYAFQRCDLDGVTLFQVEKKLSRTITAGTVGSDGWIKPPRLTLTPDEVRKAAATRSRPHCWEWEFDQEWFTRLERADSLSWRLGFSLRWAAVPEFLNRFLGLPFGLPASLQPHSVSQT